jgi:hypothetical protein
MPPSRIAVVGEPGMPSVSIGSIEPVEAELFAASGAATPSGRCPCRMSCGRFDTILATP